MTIIGKSNAPTRLLFLRSILVTYENNLRVPISRLSRGHHSRAGE